ncbi:hypothetical protein FOL46_002816 [Perkinsus olseni]|uniref:Uncharacterized protein n=1 Tax=Perkinsus olseni TaxID=32597 RepID=A0A7J6M5V6_PEROL|nr:hypothetical protein FOL46_002816 [Perkinsus olseni]
MLTTFSNRTGHEGQPSLSSTSSSSSSSECFQLYTAQPGPSYEDAGLAFKRPRLGSEQTTSASSPGGPQEPSNDALQLLTTAYSVQGPAKAMESSRSTKKPLSAWYLQCIEEDIIAVKRLVERRRLPLRGLAVVQQCNDQTSDITTTVDCSEAPSSSASSTLPLVSADYTDITSTPIDALQLLNQTGYGGGLLGNPYLPRPSQQPPRACKHGRWSSEEHLVFLEGLRDHGRDWTTITNLIPTRTNKQVRSHAQKYFQDLDRRLQDHQGSGRVVQPRVSNSQAPMRQQETDASAESTAQAKEQLAMEELLRSLTAAQGTGLSKSTTGSSENLDSNSGWNPQAREAMAARLSQKAAVETVPARAGDSLKAIMGPASGMESTAMCSSNLELAALAAVAANLTSKQGAQDVDARVAAAPFAQGLDLSAIAAAASAISCAPATPPPATAASTPSPSSGQRSPPTGLQAARSIGLLTGGDVLAMDSHLTFVDNMRSILHYFLSALPPASAAYEEVSACLKDVEAHLHECRAWAPIMTGKLHVTGQQLYERTSMLFDKYMNSNNSSLKGTSPINNAQSVPGQPCHASEQFSAITGDARCPISTGVAAWQQQQQTATVVPLVSSESPDSRF